MPIIEFSIDDIVRSGLCAMWVKAFDRIDSQGSKNVIDEMTTRIETAFRHENRSMMPS